MVIVPIIPRYLREIHAYEVSRRQHQCFLCSHFPLQVEYVGYHNETRRLANGTIIVKMTGGEIDYLNEEIEV